MKTIFIGAATIGTVVGYQYLVESRIIADILGKDSMLLHWRVGGFVFLVGFLLSTGIVSHFEKKRRRLQN